jgi:N-acetylneuraminic acid mutarotase
MSHTKKYIILVLTAFLCKIAFSQTWVQISDFPSTERDDGCSFIIGNKAYCGTGLKTGVIETGDMYLLNMNNDTWDTISSLPLGMERQYALGFSYNNQGFIFGGSKGSIYLNDLWMFDTLIGTWQNKASLPGVGRKGMCGFVINDTAYVLGGQTSTFSAISEFWAYHIPSDNWIFKGHLSFGARWRASATTDNSKGYVIFGEDSLGNYGNGLYEFDPNLNQWSLISSFPGYGRTYSSLQYMANGLLIVAGVDSLTNSYKDLWRFDLISQSWQQLNSIPAIKRRGGMCFTSNTALYYTTGKDPSNTRLKETWKAINPNSISQVEENFKITIYPNPTVKDLFVESEIQFNRFTISDVLGKIVKFANIVSNPINVVDLPDGIYFLQLSSENKSVVKKFVKQ